MPELATGLLAQLAQQGAIALMLTIAVVGIVLVLKRFLDTQDRVVAEQRTERQELVKESRAERQELLTLHREERDRWLAILDSHTSYSRDDYHAHKAHFEWEERELAAIRGLVERQK